MQRGAQPVKMTEVAEAAQVSTAVVSRIMNRDPTLRVRPETRQRVLAIAEALEYVPNAAARALRLATSGALCLVVHEVTTPLHAEILLGAQRRAAEAGFVVLLGDADELAGNRRAYENQLLSRVDGVIIHSSGLTLDTPLVQLATRRLPAVAINLRVEGGIGSVTLDDRTSVRTAVDHLLSLGHNWIGFLGGPSGSLHGTVRHQAVTQALQQAGLKLPRQWSVTGSWSVEGGQKATEELLKRTGLPGERGPSTTGSRRRQPTALVVANVMAAIGALSTLRQAGVRVPEDLSVVAIHDTWFTHATVPSLTTVKTPLLELGRAAVDVLLDMIDGQHPQDRVVTRPAPYLVERQSTAGPPGLP